jgi:hypothetical protein
MKNNLMEKLIKAIEENDVSEIKQIFESKEINFNERNKIFGCEWIFWEWDDESGWAYYDFYSKKKPFSNHPSFEKPYKGIQFLEWTPLFFAVFMNRPKAVKFLIEELKVDINIKDDLGNKASDLPSIGLKYGWNDNIELFEYFKKLSN